MAAQVASRVNEEFRSAGLSLRGDSMRLVCDFLQQQPDSDEALTQLLQALQANNLASTVVSPDDVRAALAGATAQPGGGAGAGGQRQGVLSVGGSFTFVDAFAVPRVAYDPVRRSFYSVAAPPRVLADPDAKASLYRERFHLLAQRLARNPMFGKPALRGVAAASGAAVLELTPLQALLGTTGERRFVLGALSQLEDGRFWLEDATGSCAVDVSRAATSAGLFTENCVVVAEGSLRRDGVFEARALGFPPVEPRGESLKALGPHLDMFGAGTIRQEEVGRLQQAEEEGVHEMWVLLSDVYMDQPAVVGALRRVLGAFDAQEVPPSLFLFMGDFCSSPAGASAAGLEASRGALDALGDVLREFQVLQHHSVFAFVPGPGDPSLSPALPRRTLPLTLTRHLRAAVPRAVMCSSPARVRWHSQEIVFFREDLGARMRRACVLPPVDDTPPPGGDGAAMMEQQPGQDARGHALFASLCATLQQQSHLTPLPLAHAPCLWEHDHAMWLFPQPHALVLADRSVPQSTCQFEGCACANPGAFGADGSFAVYRPASRTFELSALPLHE